MLSCDTFALTGAYYGCERNLLAKNSDRPLGEAQPLRSYEAADYPAGAMLSCTHLTVPQVAHTYAVLGCQPYWIWGFEMGVNECGLAIGNEAQGSRCEAETEEGLLGMDLLRLALERAATAREAITVITELLERYGQNANASMLFDRRYENSFLLVDDGEVWLLETAGRQWAARQVRDYAAISNCYSIGTDYDLCSAEMEAVAKAHRWNRPGEAVNFAEAYTLPAVRQSNSVHRWRRMKKLIGAAGGTLDDRDVQAILRDHYEGELIEPRFGAAYGTFVSICMHAMTWDASQTTASVLISRDRELGIKCLYAPSLPCCSVYLPVYGTGVLPAAMTVGGAVYDGDSLWWRTERLAMAVSIEEARFGPAVRTALRELEEQIRDRTAAAEAEAKMLLREGKDPAPILRKLTQDAADAMMDLTQTLAEEICAAVRADGGLYGVRKEFLEDYCGRTKLPLA